MRPRESKYFYLIKQTESVISGSLSPRHGAFSGCGWRNGLQYAGVAENILNKQSRTAERSGPPAWGWGEALTTPHCKNVSCYEMVKRKASELD
jgi:hypothetical protein